MSACRVLAVASEVFPLVKTGGLADVAGALPAALAPARRRGPHADAGLSGVIEALGEAAPAPPLGDLLRRPGRLLRGLAMAASTCSCSTRRISTPGRATPMATPDGVDWPDNAAGSRPCPASAPTSATGAVPRWRPDIVHAHDWQAALAAGLSAPMHGGRGRPPC